MTTGKIFISHSTKDDPFVKSLREKLEGQGIDTWVDSRQLTARDELETEIEKAIEEAQSFLVVISPHIINSPWVKKEIEKALAVKETRDEYRVIPILLPGVEPVALEFWFGNAPLALKIDLRTDSLDAPMRDILAALGERLPEDPQTIQDVPALPVEELILRLQDPKIESLDGTHRATATATMIYEPADPAVRRVESARYRFTAPLGAIEYEELRWYIEEFYR